MAKKPDLHSAYNLKTPEDSVRLYHDWAETYDEDFAKNSSYQLPEAVAEAFVRAEGTGHVLDIGAGTGLVGEALRALGVPKIDGTDISPTMLAEAAMKGCYDTLFESDLTAELHIESNLYDGIISAGTFTHGHVGPDAFDEILRIAKPGAVFAITINAEHFEANGFAAKLAALSDQIQSLILHKTPIYAESRTDEHAKDEALIAVFRKT